MIQDVSIPKMAVLSQERLPKNNQFVFETTGLDFIGPFLVKNNGKLFSRYVLLFTCLVVRAVYLKVSNDLSTDSTINCIKRFVSRREKPNKFISDCGKSFFGSNNSLQSSIADLRASKFFAAKLHLMKVEIVLKLNPPAAPHFGGIRERLVQIFKLSLYKVIGSRTLIDEILCTVTCELEVNINSRPLTNVPGDINDPLPLTPDHFLLGRSSVNLPPGVFVRDKKNISKAWRTSQQIAAHFWNRFLREYLPGQQIRSKWNECSKNLKVDDLVWILEDFTPRGLWPVARVTQVFPEMMGSFDQSN